MILIFKLVLNEDLIHRRLIKDSFWPAFYVLAMEMSRRLIFMCTLLHNLSFGTGSRPACSFAWFGLVYWCF